MSSQSIPSRRVFMFRIAAGGGALASLGVRAQAPVKVDEKDAQASALGYVGDTAKADEKKYPKHAKDQKCSGCQLYSGKAADASGPCALFAGKYVAASGWCSAWAKKTS